MAEELEIVVDGLRGLLLLAEAVLGLVDGGGGEGAGVVFAVEGAPPALIEAVVFGVGRDGHSRGLLGQECGERERILVELVGEEEAAGDVGPGLGEKVARLFLGGKAAVRSETAQRAVDDDANIPAGVAVGGGAGIEAAFVCHGEILSRLVVSRQALGCDDSVLCYAHGRCAWNSTHT